MMKLRSYIAAFTYFICTVSAAQGAPPSFSAPDTTIPGVAAFVAWHAAMVHGDFASYRRLSPVVPNITNDSLKMVFESVRSTAPKVVKISPPKTNRSGGYEFSSAGCNGGRPVVSVVIVTKVGETWQVTGSGWGPSWNPKISDFVKCP